jgi:hypothetical protein
MRQLTPEQRIALVWNDLTPLQQGYFLCKLYAAVALFWLGGPALVLVPVLFPNYGK